MTKKFLILTGLTLALVVALWALAGFETREHLPTSVSTEVRRSDIAIKIEGINLVAGETATRITTKSLRPEFSVSSASAHTSADMYLRIDGFDIFASPDLVSDATSSAGVLSFRPAFLLEPGRHRISIGYKDERLTGEEYDISIVVLDTFDENRLSPNLFVIPDTTKAVYEKSWYVEKGALRCGPINDTHHASLALLYPQRDADISFTLTPMGKEIGLAVYFLELGYTFIIGNGSDSRMTLLREKEKSVDGKKMSLEAGKKYRVNVSRHGETYSMSITPDGSELNPPLITFTSNASTSQDGDHVGLSLWPGSDGVQIDDFQIE